MSGCSIPPLSPNLAILLGFRSFSCAGDVSVCGRPALVGGARVRTTQAEVTFELQRVFGVFGAKFARLQAQVTARPRLSLHRLVTVKVNHLSMGGVSEQTGQPVGFARSII
jgi:hypothetical protein